MGNLVREQMGHALHGGVRVETTYDKDMAKVEVAPHTRCSD